MNRTAAAQFRAQIPASTDPAWLERMARHVEQRAAEAESKPPTHCPICGKPNRGDVLCGVGGCPVGGDL